MEYSLFQKLGQKRFILASTSQNRIDILKQMGFKDFEIIPSQFEEDLKKEDFTPQEYVRHTAIEKAKAVYEDLKAKNQHKNTVILAADTVIELEGKIYEKPKDKADNLKTLTHFRDCPSPQHALSGVVVIVDGELDSFVESTTLYFDAEVSDELIKAYADSEEGLGAAAGYRVQKKGALFMKRFEGDFYNIVGLPFRNTFTFLEKHVK